ncbi:MbnP family protein [uncultured Polaribacter sp.]|uniref:MbnP family protein n=1 Tax=uncultured Polaribacter sp. TaxID=174711 RepID=UPI000AD2880D|nr:hypothetical protein [Polaribacter sp.]|tara:strand:+ start:13698 stop:14447 length:750 start_codon:yes stop_codon:yes gene_type:complete
MKKQHYLLLLMLFLVTRCSEEIECCVQPEQADVTLNFTHYWDGIKLSNQDLNQLKFTTKNGENVSVENLRYLISELSLIDSKNYHLINFTENTGTSISLSGFTNGTYKLTFRFGFSDEDNTDGAYKDLNSVNFGVPGMLGGGYHYMQFDGKYIDNNNEEAGFNYHTIRAVDKTEPDNLKFEDTSFNVDLGTVIITKNTDIEIKMNLAEWFKNPTTWDLNKLNTVLMPNFEAQQMMRDNGKTAFSLGTVN